MTEGEYKAVLLKSLRQLGVAFAGGSWSDQHWTKEELADELAKLIVINTTGQKTPVCLTVNEEE